MLALLPPAMFIVIGAAWLLLAPQFSSFFEAISRFSPIKTNRTIWHANNRALHVRTFRIMGALSLLAGLTFMAVVLADRI